MLSKIPQTLSTHMQKINLRIQTGVILRASVCAPLWGVDSTEIAHLFYG